MILEHNKREILAHYFQCPLKLVISMPEIYLRGGCLLKRVVLYMGAYSKLHVFFEGRGLIMMSNNEKKIMSFDM